MSHSQQLLDLENENDQLKLDKIELRKDLAVSNGKVEALEKVVRYMTQASNEKSVRLELELRDAKEKLKLSEEKNTMLEKSIADLREAITSTPEVSDKVLIARLKLQVKKLQGRLSQQN